MSVKFFGQYLLERGTISREALLKALELQDTRNLRLGDYAVRRGYLTEAQSEQINRIQLTEDKRFGEIAKEKGLLTEEQIGELLTLQQNDYLMLGEALLEVGPLDRQTLEAELKNFKADQEKYLTDDVIFPPGVKEPSLLAIPIDLTAKMLLRIAAVTSKIGEGERSERPPVARLISVAVDFSGGLTAKYLLSLSEDIARKVALPMLGEDPGDDHEAVIDSVRELCNVICGNSAAKLAQLGKAVEIGPPMMVEGPLPAHEQAILFPLHVADGAAEVRILR
ncbi:MAG: chemotaxis protein CheX [Deltaproteobacteria bacterium]|nr:chemotaxis protein CheX [Deltaproteobacteria bacterium]